MLTGPPGARPDRRYAPSLAGGMVLLAALLRSFRLGDQELWYDEAYSYQLATITTNLGTALAVENNPPLYYLILRAWAALAGTSEAALRVPSAVFGTLFVLLLFLVGRRIFSPSAGLWSAFLAAIAPVQISYSQEARCYTLLLCLLLATYLFVWRALERDAPSDWLLACLTALGALHTHYLALFGLLPTAAIVALLPDSTRRKKLLLRYGLLVLSCLLLTLPWVLWSFLLHAHPLASSAWVKDAWAKTPPVLALPKSFLVFAVGHDGESFPMLPKVFPYLAFPRAFRWLGAIAAGALMIAALVPWGDRHAGISEIGRKKLCLGIAFLLPLVAQWGMSLIRPIYVVGRYDLVSYAAFSLLVGYGLVKFGSLPFRARWLAWPLVGCLILPIAVKLVRYYDLSVQTVLVPSGRVTAATIAAAAVEGDIVAFTLQRGTPALYYLSKLGYRWENGECRPTEGHPLFRCLLIPPEEEIAFGMVHDSLELSSLARSLLLALPGPQSSIWFVSDARSLHGTLFMLELSGIGLKGTSYAQPVAPGIVRFHRR